MLQWLVGWFVGFLGFGLLVLVWIPRVTLRFLLGVGARGFVLCGCDGLAVWAYSVVLSVVSLFVV